jgi:nicotinamidase/pyrazinamidase
VAQYDENTVLIVVDVQNDFAAREGSLYVPGAEEALPRINEEIRRAREAGAHIFYTQDWHPPSTPHFEKDGGIWPVHCVAGSRGAEFHPELELTGEIVKKGTEGEDGYSGFSVRDPEGGEEKPTGLESRLKERGVTRVVVVGLATDYCVKETALDSLRLGFQTTVVKDAVRAVDRSPGDGDKALEAVRLAGGKIT